MGLFDKIKQGLESALASPTPEEIEASLAQLTPEQRASYHAQMAQAANSEAEAQAEYERARAISESWRILDGPAGEALHGPSLAANSPEATRERLAQDGGGGMLKDSLKAFGQELKGSVSGGKVPTIADPARRAAVAAEERAARDAARAPYLAAGTGGVAFTRIATRGETQVQEVIDHLRRTGLADHPERVYGVYRVPDRISPALTDHSERGRVVEWDIVHEPGAEGGPSPTEVHDTWIPARPQWVARRLGEPSVLDEEVALAYCLRAGVGPERCLGVARHGEFIRPPWGSEHQPIRTGVTGVHVLHPAGIGGDALAAMAAEAPITLSADDLAGTHTEVLDVEAIRAVNHPRPQDPVPVPAPFPYLPSTGPEPLGMYLEVVGVRAADCYGAQVTVDRYQTVESRAGAGSTNLGPKQPCADGKARMRITAAEQVVVTYRDSAAYAEGRARWAAYQQDVLLAHLERNTGARRPVTDPDAVGSDNRLVRAGAALLDAIDRIDTFGEDGRPPSPHRYCWPPVG